MTVIENDKTKQSYYQDVALQVFLTGLNEPYGSMLRAKDPSTLVDAIRFLEREELVRYRQRQLPSSTLNQKPTMSQKTYLMPNPTSTQGSSFPSQPIHIQPKPVQQKFYTNQQVFGKPKNVFKPGQNVPYNKPTPMSVSTKTFRPQYNQTPMSISNKTTGKQNYFQNYGQKPNFVSEELFETEDDTFDDSENQNLQYCIQEVDNMHFENDENEGYDDESTDNLNFQLSSLTNPIT
ncbi:hypothetical protein ILUMI_21294 [Ignelater luminosus]|uniref:Uncharacterized protein n=1 Tax=Ignelater luminosus TaxID=2038154 RepID=A0A8K0CJ55_IGNLU|nr:hypothetical protein ILUMI_21294 [Ignelater luminosus]